MSLSHGVAARRQVLCGVAAALATTLAPAAGWARAGERRLKFRHLHTDERLDVTYYVGGRYRPAELLKIDHLFRDWRAGQSTRIDHRLLDLLYEVQVGGKHFAEVEVLSGYRTEATNRMLRARSRGVASRSLHLVGKAVDMRLEGQSIASTRKTALRLAAGGVGYYPRSNFVHLDTGAVRSWS